MPKMNLAAIKSKLYPHLQAQGHDNALIAQVTNTLTVNGNNNISFQAINNLTININVDFDSDFNILRLSRQIGRYLNPPKIPKWLGQQWRQTSPFIGRKKEIQDIEDILAEQQALVLVNGIGGEGKTVLANAIMKQEPCLYEHLIWTNCQNAPDENKNILRNALLYNSYQLHLDLGIVEDLKETNNENEKWGILMNAFKKLNGKVLWVIDNARQGDFQAIRDLPQNCKILLTSREKIGNLKIYTLNELNEVDALKLFKTYYTQKDDDEILKQICETVGRHALSIELLAHTLNNLYDKDATYLLEQLQENGLNIKRKIAVWTDYEAKETYLNDCLLLAFTLGNIAMQIELHPLLQLFTLLPYQTTPFFLLKYLQQVEDETASDDLRNYIRTLAKLGWIKQENTNAIKPNQKGWMMHPVIQDCIGQQLPVEQITIKRVVQTLWKQTWYIYDKNQIEAQVYQPYMKHIAFKNKIEDENNALSYDIIANLNEAIGYYNIALEYNQKALIIYQKILPANHNNLAIIYNNLGNICSRLTNYKTALKWQKKCLKIWKINLHKNHNNLAAIYNNLASTYQSLMKFEKALIYQRKSLDIYQKNLPIDYKKIALSYNNIGNIYANLTSYQKALEYQKKSLTIYQNILPNNHSNLATVYNNIATIYQNLTNYPKALEYQKKCLQIWENILEYNNPDLAIIYNNIAITYQAMQDFQKTLEYQKKCLAIREEILPEKHQDLANIYNNIALTYQVLTNFQKALEYQKKCLAIREEILPEKHPDLATVYNNIALTYQDLTNFQKALEYQEKCLAIREEILSENHPDLASIYNNIAASFANLQQFQRALNYQKKCLTIRSQILSAKNQDLGEAYINISILYLYLSQFPEALIHIEKAITIYKKLPDYAKNDLQKALQLKEIIKNHI